MAVNHRLTYIGPAVCLFVLILISGCLTEKHCGKDKEGNETQPLNYTLHVTVGNGVGGSMDDLYIGFVGSWEHDDINKMDPMGWEHKNSWGENVDLLGPVRLSQPMNEMRKDFNGGDMDWGMPMMDDMDGNAAGSPMLWVDQVMPQPQRSQDMSQLARSQDMSQLARSQDMSQLARSQDMSQLARSQDMSQLARSQDMSHLKDRLWSPMPKPSSQVDLSQLSDLLGGSMPQLSDLLGGLNNQPLSQDMSQLSDQLGRSMRPKTSSQVDLSQLSDLLGGSMAQFTDLLGGLNDRPLSLEKSMAQVSELSDDNSLSQLVDHLKHLSQDEMSQFRQDMSQFLKHLSQDENEMSQFRQDMSQFRLLGGLLRAKRASRPASKNAHTHASNPASENAHTHPAFENAHTHEVKFPPQAYCGKSLMPRELFVMKKGTDGLYIHNIMMEVEGHDGVTHKYEFKGHNWLDDSWPHCNMATLTMNRESMTYSPTCYERGKDGAKIFGKMQKMSKMLKMLGVPHHDPMMMNGDNAVAGPD